MVISYTLGKVFFPECSEDDRFEEEPGRLSDGTLVFTWEEYLINAMIDDCSIPSELLDDAAAKEAIENIIVEPVKAQALGDIEPAKELLEKLRRRFVGHSIADFCHPPYLGYRRDPSGTCFEISDHLRSGPFLRILNFRKMPFPACVMLPNYIELFQLAEVKYEFSKGRYVQGETLQQAVESAYKIYVFAERLKEKVRV